MEDRKEDDMTGKPGRSGGSRPGAGRPVATRTLHTGMQLLYHETDNTGRPTVMPSMATVEIVSRTKIVLHMDNGNQIILGY